MITLEQLQEIEGFLLSDRVKIGGHEFLRFAAMIGSIQAEARQIMATRRVSPVVVPIRPAESPSPPDDASGRVEG